jgi:pimeloyl-ACP methyl ester carboxylesterase
MQKKIGLLLGFMLIAVAIWGLWTGDSALADAQDIAFATHDNSTWQDTLNGTYYPGASAYGVVLAHGFSGSETMMRPLAVAFAQAGIHVLTFNFSGHGDSDGSLTLDNAQQDRIAQQMKVAMDTLQTRANIPHENMVLVGHSMGARAILHMTTLYPQPSISGIVLLGAQVNLATNTQSEFFTGTSDTSQAWVQGLNEQNPSTNLHLISGAWDDILTPPNARLLLQTLLSDSADTIRSDTVAFGDIGQKNYRALTIVPNQIHNYEIYDPTIIKATYESALRFMWLNPTQYPLTNEADMRPLWWLMGVSGAFGALFGTLALLPAVTFNSTSQQITHTRRFLREKILLWLLVLPLLAGFIFLTFLIPLPKPLFTLLYSGFIGTYGVLLWLLYRTGWMPATSGYLKDDLTYFSSDKNKSPLMSIRWIEERYWVVLVGIFVLALTAMFAMTGWFSPPLTPVRLVWLGLFTLVTAVGFWVGHYESALLAQANASRLTRVLHVLIGLLPFFAYAMLLGALGSLSGFVGAINGLAILLGVVLLGECLLRLRQNVVWVSCLQALVLFWLVLPQSALFGL